MEPTPTSSTTPPHQRANVRIVTFLALTYALSWVPWIALARNGADIDEGAGFLVFALAASGPSLVAVVLWLRHRPPRRRSPRRSLRGTLAALLIGAIPPALTAVVLQGPGGIPGHAASTVAGVGGPLAAAAYTLISGPLAEELGWRGYLQPLVRRRAGRIRAAVLIGIVWACWHLPLFWMDGTSQQERGVLTIGGLRSCCSSSRSAT